MKLKEKMMDLNHNIENSMKSEVAEIKFSEIFELDKIQQIQDLFADATGVASIITTPDGAPITKPSNFCHLCSNIIRKTEKGLSNCFKSDALIGKYNSGGPNIQPCLSCGLWDAGASITVGGKHIANWLIGQIRNEQIDEQHMLKYADEIKADKDEFIKALHQVPVMSVEQFSKVSKMLFTFANELSEKAYNNLLLKKQIEERKKAEEEILKQKNLLNTIIESSSEAIFAKDKEGKYKSVNGAGAKIFGLEVKDIIDKTDFELLPFETASEFRKTDEQVMSKGELFEREETGIINDKKYIFLAHKTPWRDDNDKIIGIIGISTNITERKKAEDALIQSENNYRRFLDESPLGIRIITEEGKTLYVNSALLQIYGFENYEEYVQTPISQRYTENEKLYHKIRKEKRKKGETIPIKYEIEIVSKKGEIRYLDVIRKEIFWNQTKQFQVIYLDITERKLAEKALFESNELISLFISHSPIYTYIKEVNPSESRIVRASENFIDMLGISGSDMIGKNMFELFPEEHAEKMTADDWEVMSNGKMVKLDEELRGHYYSTIKFPIELGNKNLLAGYIIDITERKLAEIEMNKAKILLEQTFEQSPIPMVLVSMPDAVIRIANPACISFLGAENEPSTVGTSLMDLKASWQDFDLDGNPAKTEELPLYRSLMGQKTNGQERYLVRKDGTIRYELVYGCPIFDEKGNLLAGYLVMLDITDRKKAEMLLHEKNEEYLQINEELIQTNDELMQAKERAEESEKLKTAFLQNMSHEIRTPMNAIIGFSGMLDRPDLSDSKRANYISIITNSSNQLLSIVTDILTISSIETRQEKLNMEKVCINSLLVDLLSIFKSQAHNRNISLYTKQQLTDFQSEVYTDKTKITQILTNLITNALKFTHEGFVEFGYTFLSDKHALGSGSGPVALQFYVKDTGIGIEKHQQSKIFERFRQADLAINKTYGGTGLGLSISQGFVELMGGKIWVNSEPKNGSTFYFTIPYKPVNELESIVSILKHDRNKSTILVAEDEEFNFLLIEEFLINLDFILVHSKDGQETVDICKANPNIILVLMDIKMPIMDGHTAALIIKEFRPDLPIIAQTAYALAHEIEKYKDNAFDDYVIKPIDEKELKDKIKKCIDKV